MPGIAQPVTVSASPQASHMRRTCGSGWILIMVWWACEQNPVTDDSAHRRERTFPIPLAQGARSLSRIGVLPALAGSEGPLQADGVRRRVGSAAAAVAHAGLHRFPRQDR